MKKKNGRPHGFTQEIADAICEKIADGCSVRSICKADDMPALSSVFKWLKEIKGFSEQYARAKEMQADALFEDILDIADSQEGDIVKRADGSEHVNHDNINRAKLRIDSRKWMAGKLRPKVYGDLVRKEVSGPDGGPIQTEGVAIYQLPDNGRS